ncbi:hypothetical protein D3C76_1458900 [compost metagenome]
MAEHPDKEAEQDATGGIADHGLVAIVLIELVGRQQQGDQGEEGEGHNRLGQHRQEGITADADEQGQQQGFLRDRVRFTHETVHP